MRQPPITLKYFLEPDYSYHNLSNNIENVVWFQRFVTHFVFYSTRKRWRTEQNVCKQRWLLAVMLPNIFRYPLKFFTTYYRQRDLMFGGFFSNIHVSKIRNYCKFLPWPTFSMASVTRIRWPNTLRSFWWKLDENWLNDVVDVQRFFQFFQATHFPPGKWRRSCAATSIHATKFLSNSSTLIIICKQFSNWLNSFREN